MAALPLEGAARMPAVGMQPCCEVGLEVVAAQRAWRRTAFEEVLVVVDRRVVEAAPRVVLAAAAADRTASAGGRREIAAAAVRHRGSEPHVSAAACLQGLRTVGFREQARSGLWEPLSMLTAVVGKAMLRGQLGEGLVRGNLKRRETVTAHKRSLQSSRADSREFAMRRWGSVAR